MAQQRSTPTKPLRDIVARVEEMADEAGDRVSTFLEDGEIRRRLSDAIDALDDVRLELMRRVRGEPATTPLEEMTVRELHELAREHDIAGRSSMNKAELIDAIRSAG